MTSFSTLGAVVLLITGAIAGVAGVFDVSGTTAGVQPAPAYFMRSLQNPAERQESRPDVLDTPILPGSVMKAVTLAAALDSQVIEPDTSRICRRVVTVDGRRYVCSHPDLKRPLTPAEALAHSCDDFFVSLAPRLSRAMVNTVRARLGVPPIAEAANLRDAFVGLDGPRITPRALLDVIARLAGADAERASPISTAARHVLLEGLKGASEYGSAQALGARGVSALAKTGTAPMPGGAWMGLVVALEPADTPIRGIVVVAPGAAGVDAAAIAADLLSPGRGRSLDSPGSSDPPIAAIRSKNVVPSSSGLSKDPSLPVTIRIGVAGSNGSTRVVRYDLEDYIGRVVAGEGEPNAPEAAQQALAITARTFALANLQRHRRENFDLCDTTHCQVTRAPTTASRRAAQATAGRVVVHQGQPATIFYSASCGGHSELASEVWPGAVNYAVRSQRDDACRGEPQWVSQVRIDDIERALRIAGHRGDRLRDLRVIDRNDSNRVARLRVDGFTPAEISGHDFRMALGRVAGWQRMKSTAFEVRRTSNGYQFRGRGFGHGVGLCVIGAGNRAISGASANDILRFYFPNLRIATYRAAPHLTDAAVSVDSPVMPVPADPRPADVLIALPGAEESERSHIVQLIRATRDQIQSKAGVTAPASIRITVHPTVEAFGRATGQPWWVSGATQGATIDLLPLSILRQQGQLERTIRHEVAHVLLDASLAGRPLWVREGAAFYFADPLSYSEAPGLIVPGLSGRTPCPADVEFLRPLSAGVHRSAYARAQACFRRAIATGKKWNDVR